MIPFNQLVPAHEAMRPQIDTAIQRVVDSGWFILGPEVEAFESEFAAYHGISHCVGVANGTDAIELALAAAGIGPGDEVITVAHTAVATVCAVERAGATPVLVDIDPDTYTMDPQALLASITPRTRAIIPVHLYGQAADMTRICEIAERHQLLVIEDCAQAHGARHMRQLVGTFGTLATFSFYPTKNLGAIGDGGAVLTHDAEFAARLRQLRNYGQTSRYLSAGPGINSRLDELQAAILRAKLPHLDSFNAARRELAGVYDAQLDAVEKPFARPGDKHVYHLYVIQHSERDALQRTLERQSITTLIHYPTPVHLQPAFAHLGYGSGALPVTERVAQRILSLPLYIGLANEDVNRVAFALHSSVELVRQ